MSKILLVEDHTYTHQLLRTLLEIEGFQVAACSNPLETTVLEAVSKEQPQVVLMDVHLKSANGIELLKKIRALSNLDQPKVIMLSGEDLQYECLQAGADGFLLKPFAPAQLIRMIRQSLEKQPL